MVSQYIAMVTSMVTCAQGGKCYPSGLFCPSFGKVGLLQEYILNLESSSFSHSERLWKDRGSQGEVLIYGDLARSTFSIPYQHVFNGDF